MAGGHFGRSVRWEDPNDPARAAAFDTKFAVPLSISTEHSKIHEGVSFERHIDSANAAVAALNVAFKTLAGTRLAHMIFGFGSSDEILWELIEGATWTQGTGTALTVFNNNRASGVSTVILEDKNQATFTASNAMVKDVTGIANGTTFDNQYTYNASLGASKQAESRTAAHEWLLKPGTTYIARATKTDANCKISINIHWYEHTPG